MKKIIIFIVLIVSSVSPSIIVPQETTTLIDFILKFLPPFRKGIEDSRIGFGFAFGNHSDFQTVVQFGPDKVQPNELSTSVTKRRVSTVQKEGKALKYGPTKNSESLK